MKRKMFFWLEKLKISPAERNAVSLLVAILTVLLIINSVIPDTSTYDSDYYLPLEQAFNERSKMLEEKEQQLLARYQPSMEVQVAAVRDTVTSDSMKADKQQTEPNPREGMVNVNSADAKELQSLPGIGPAYAGRIIEYRQKNGAFTSYEELLKIKGIGKKRLEKLLPFIQLKEPIEN